MDSGNVRASSQKNEAFLLLALFIFELSLVVLAMAIYLKGDRSFAFFLFKKPGIAFVAAICALVTSGAVIIRCFFANLRSPSRTFSLVVAMNVVSVMLILIFGEIAVRAGVRTYYGYEALGTLVLKPKNWEAIKRYYSKFADQEAAGTSFQMYDPNLGWTVRPNSHSSNELYWSSAEGLRAPREHVSFAGHTEQTDIALVGDSFTFGEEVSYEETYGYYLEQMLGAQARVLNFGVPGYGIDQMFLRYQKDVRAWKPKIVILGFISHDVKRTLWVYNFLGDIRWKSPFPHPHFTLEKGELVNVAESLPTPKAIFSSPSIARVPLIQLQSEYRWRDWDAKLYHQSYLIRVFEAWASRLYDTSERVSLEGMQLNAQLLKAFVQSVKQEGSIPFVVFFPSGNELKKPSSTRSLGKKVLQQAGIDYIDPTPCLLEVDPVNRSRPGLHYSALGNAAAAKCIYGAVQKSLAQPPGGFRQLHAVNDGVLQPH